jgi:uncharacterized protein with PIN domain
MGLLRTMILSVVSAKMAAAMEADSRSWILTCPTCGNEISIWDLGGIRYKATGNQRTFIKCRKCGKWGWHRTAKRA